MSKYILDADFCAKRKGNDVKPDGKKGEFLYDTNHTILSIGQIKEIAGMNGLKLKSSGRVEATKELNNYLEGKKLTDQNAQTLSEKVNSLVVCGREQGLSEDEILVSIVQAGVKFSVAVREYKRAKQELGIEPDRKVIRESITNEVASISLDFANSDELFDVVKDIAHKLGAEQSKVIVAIKKRAKQEGTVLPRLIKAQAPRVAGWAGYHTRIFDYLLANPQTTNAELHDALETLYPKEAAKDGKIAKYVRRYAPILGLVKRAKGLI